MTQSRIKRLAASASALVVALAMGSAGAVTANAALAAPPTTNLTVKNAAGRTFKALRVGVYEHVTASPANVTVTTVADPAQVKTSSTNALKTMFTSTAPAGVAEDPIAYIATNWGITQDGATSAINAGKPQYDGKVRQFLTAIWQDGDFKALFNTAAAVTATADGNGDAKFSDIPTGEYIVVDVTTYDSTKGTTLPMFVSTLAKDEGNNDVKINGMTEEVEAKGVVPVRPKKTTDKSDYNVGDKVKFNIKTTVPTYMGYSASSYKLILHDTLSTGLKFDPNSADAKVKLLSGSSPSVPDKEITASPTNGYELTPSTVLTDGGAIHFDLSPFFRDRITENDGRYAGYTIDITYYAVLNESAITQTTTSDGVHNEVKVEYSNEPDGTSTGETEKGKAKVFTFNFDLLKKDKATNDALAGAKFKVSNDDNTVLSFIKRTDGTYRLAQTGETGIQELTTDSNGQIKIVGVASGSYKVEETDPAPGYMKMPSAMTFVAQIEPEYSTDATTGTVSLVKTKYGIPTADSYGLASIPNEDVGTFLVHNVKNLTQLPLTGAAGIMFLIVVGGLLVAAGVFLYMASVRSRRNESTAVRV